MAKVLLGEVVDRIKDKVDKDATDLEYYVGGEHIDGDEITVRRKGLIQGSTIGPAFHMRFQRGDVLLMSRNPHLRKASMVDFDGICSDVSYICRTKDNNILLQSLLPFILQTSEFWQFAEENKKGGLPFFLNWKDFARFEFELIPIERQRKISNLLWAMERVKNAYRELIARTDDLVKSQFTEMFGDPIINNYGWKQISLLDSLEKGRTVTYGIVQTGEDVKNGVPVFRPVDISGGHIPKRNELKKTDPLISARYKRTLLKGNELLITVRGSIGETFQVTNEFEGCNVARNIVPLVTDKNKIEQRFLQYLFATDSIKKWLKEITKGSALQGLNMSEFKEMPVIVPPLEKQQQFILFSKQSDKSKYLLQHAKKAFKIK